eukprot:TRINITY_DN28398_c0_g1_i5.p1 TRINITY_DN28398_c0_g1~~TRINITY_DN28398_c0_g1_i5.p1  ORF type:complete len:136 (-),score=34.82 TRINITY_DN28398_c0_g1_i5:76-483(-)
MLQKIQEEEEAKRRLRERNHQILMNQIHSSRIAKRQNEKLRKEIPDIFGCEGYPPIFEVSPQKRREDQKAVHSFQREALQKQISEKKLETKKSKEEDWVIQESYSCLLYTSDAADDTPCVDLGGRRMIQKKNKKL